MDMERGGVRAIYPGFELRAQGEGVTMAGHFAVFNQWTEIRSVFEGDFVERLAPGCFTKTFQERGSRIKVLFNHGRDPLIGDKVLGSITHLAEDRRGAAYEVDLLDTEYVRELVPALDRGLYGASFRFRPLKVTITEKPEASSHNPSALPECTVTEASVSEFGPVTFPAYQGATAGLRCLTDELAFSDLTHADRLEQLASYAERIERRPSLPGPRASAPPAARLWGSGEPADELPAFYRRRQAQLRGSGLVEGG